MKTKTKKNKKGRRRTATAEMTKMRESPADDYEGDVIMTVMTPTHLTCWLGVGELVK